MPYPETNGKTKSFNLSFTVLLLVAMRALHLSAIRLLNFKNHAEQTCQFSPKINGVLGANGTGKTSLLDAIHFLSMCKSYFVGSDKLIVKKGEEQYMVQGTFEREGHEEVLLGTWREGHRKVFKRDDKAYDRLADHIGRYPVVMIAPKDHELIDGGSEVRRRFADQVISQSDAQYLHALLRFNRLLIQRNALLKDSGQGVAQMREMLDVLNAQMIDSAEYIYASRKAFTQAMRELVEDYYEKISGARESAALRYESHLHERSFEEILKLSIDADMRAGHTTRGIHKDDLLWEMNGERLKVFGSQGQQKSFLIALKLAQFDFLGKKCGWQPILLLDDIFDKLDATRVTQLIELVNTHHFGQIFITDTDAERTANILQRINEDSQIIAFDK